MLHVLMSFLLRDFRRTLSYKLAFVLDLTSIFFNAATFYFVARLVDPGRTESLLPYGGDYFPFVLIGIAFSTYQGIGLNSFAQSLRQEQFLGTMESVLVSPIRIPTFLAGSALWDFLYATLEVFLYFVVAIVAFGMRFPQANFISAGISLVLTLVTFMGLGILAAAFILWFKRGNPVTWLIATASELFAGVYFPTQILPDWMKAISNWVPMTHALSALRLSFLSNASLTDIKPHLIYLFFFAVIIWPLGIGAFQLSLRKSQKDGTLGHY